MATTIITRRPSTLRTSWTLHRALVRRMRSVWFLFSRNQCGRAILSNQLCAGSGPIVQEETVPASPRNRNFSLSLPGESQISSSALRRSLGKSSLGAGWSLAVVTSRVEGDERWVGANEPGSRQNGWELARAQAPDLNDGDGAVPHGLCRRLLRLRGVHGVVAFGLVPC